MPHSPAPSPEIAGVETLPRIDRPLWDSIDRAVKAEMASRQTDGNSIRFSVKGQDGRWRTAVAARFGAGPTDWTVVGWMEAEQGEKPMVGVEGEIAWGS